jgi:hypothetical protein
MKTKLVLLEPRYSDGGHQGVCGEGWYCIVRKNEMVLFVSPLFISQTDAVTDARQWCAARGIETEREVRHSN